MPPRVFLLKHSRFWLILFIYISSSNHKMILTHILFRKWFTYRVSNPISTLWNYWKIVKTLDFCLFLRVFFAIFNNFYYLKWYFFILQKFHDFSITPILCEINFGDCRKAKSAILTHLNALKSDCCEILHFLKDQIYQISKIQSP